MRIMPITPISYINNNNYKKQNNEQQKSQKGKIDNRKNV